MSGKLTDRWAGGTVGCAVGGGALDCGCLFGGGGMVLDNGFGTTTCGADGVAEEGGAVCGTGATVGVGAGAT